MKIGDREFRTKGHTYVMGILNVTPDSFSDGGRWNDRDRALRHVEDMIKGGADIIDIGGESTRPGFAPVPAEEEIGRVVPMIREIKSRFDIPLSLDTYKAETARAGIAAGADMINDIWGLKQNKEMAGVIAESGLPCCLMHNRRDMNYGDFMRDVAADLAETVEMAEKAGIARDKIILDPGVGFAKTYEQNLEVIHSLAELHSLGYPLLLGCSRKSVVGLCLNLPADERVEGTLVTTVMAAMKGCMFVRVHDVVENVRAVKMTEAILQGGKASCTVNGQETR